MIARTQRLLLLKTVTKLMLLIVLLCLAWVLLGGFLQSGQQTIAQEIIIDMPDIQAGQSHVIHVERRDIIILSRPTPMQACLRALGDELFDASSRFSKSTAELDTVLRSHVPEYFIVYAQEPNLGCPLEYIQAKPSELANWCGGFRDVCQGSYYDAAGRVYKGQRGQQNLKIPRYEIKGQRLILFI